MVESLYFQETKQKFKEYWVKMQTVVVDVLLHPRFIKYFKWYIDVAKPETWAAYGADSELSKFISLLSAI